MAVGAGRARNALVAPAMQDNPVATPRMAGPPAPPTIPASPVGAGLQDLGQGLAALAVGIQRDQDNRDSLKRIQYAAEFNVAAAAKTAGLDPTTVDYTQLVRQGYDEAAEETYAKAGDDFHSQRAMDELRASVVQTTGQAERAAIVARHQAIGSLAETQFNASAHAALAAIRRNPDGEDVYLADFGNIAKDLVKALPGDKAAALTLSFAQDAIIARTEGYALKGRFDEARAYAAAHEDAMEPAAFRALKGLVREIEGDQQRTAVASTNVLTAQYRIEIGDANTVAGLDEIRRKVERQSAAGLFNNQEGTYASIIGSIQARRSSIISETHALNTAVTNFDNGTLDGTQKQTDLAWGAYRSVLPPNAPVAAQVAHMQQFVTRAGHVPSSVHDLIANAELVNNPDQLATAAEFWDGLMAAGVPPSVNTGAAKENSRVIATSTFVELAKMSYADAARLVTDAMPDNATLSARREQFKKDFDAETKFDAVAYIQNQVGFGGKWAGLERNIPVPPTVARDFERGLRLFYEMNGDANASKAMALKQFNTMYGVTSVGGVSRVAKLPPENYFPPAIGVALSHNQRQHIITEDVRRTLNDLSVVAAIVIGDKEDTSGIPAFGLEADANTERDVAEGRLPEYRVLVRNSIGDLVPIRVTKNDGSRVWLTYTPPDAARLQTNPEYRAILDAAKTTPFGGWVSALPAGLQPKLILEDTRATFRGTKGAIQGGVDALRPLVTRPDFKLNTDGPIFGK